MKNKKLKLNKKKAKKPGIKSLFVTGITLLIMLFIANSGVFGADNAYEYPRLDDVQSTMNCDSPVDGHQNPVHMSTITQSISIFTPPGTGGLKPAVGLTYNSQSADQIGQYQQASVCGLGWSISGISYVFIREK